MEAFTMRTEEHEQNRSSWNLATEQHHRHQPQLVSDYVDKARNKLFAEDMKLLGDLKGKDVLHLQCNDGQDTVSIARWLKPRQVHGVDISDFAVNFAKELSTKMLEQKCFDATTEVRFTRRDVVEYLNDPIHSNSVDVVYSSYGTVNWLSNLKTWAMGIANVLRPGGRFVIIDFHAVAMALDWQSMKLKYDCLGGNSCPSDDGVSDYIGQDTTFQNPNPSMEYAWGVGDIVSSLLETRQMHLQSLTEYPYVNGYQMHESLCSCNVPSPPEAPKGQPEGTGDSAAPVAGYGGLPQDARYAPPSGSPVTPMMYSIVATKHDKKRSRED